MQNMVNLKLFNLIQFEASSFKFVQGHSSSFKFIQFDSI